MRISKPEFALIIVLAVAVGATFGYLLARIPVAGTFEVNTANIIVMPSLTMPAQDETQSVTADPLINDAETSPGPTGIMAVNTPEAQDETPEPVQTATPTPTQAPTSEPTPSPPPETPTPPQEEDTIVNVNTAGLEELQLLPGIGPVLAQRIIDERANGAFISWEDLTRVSGIGEKTAEKLKPYIKVR